MNSDHAHRRQSLGLDDRASATERYPPREVGGNRDSDALSDETMGGGRGGERKGSEDGTGDSTGRRPITNDTGAGVEVVDEDDAAEDEEDTDKEDAVAEPDAEVKKWRTDGDGAAGDSDTPSTASGPNSARELTNAPDATPRTVAPAGFPADEVPSGSGVGVPVERSASASREPRERRSPRPSAVPSEEVARSGGNAGLGVGTDGTGRGDRGGSRSHRAA